MRGPLHPSDAQEQLLAFLPIPSAILSVFGSSVIIYMIFKSKQQRNLTPYLRLLFAMSVYDIVSSLNWSVAAFLRPQDTSLRLLSIGNNTTCNIVGFVNQISHATMIYQGMLGLYFLLTARYGYSNSYIARRIEPWMHVVSIGYPIAFAIAQAVLDVYGEVTMGIGCWLVAGENCATEFLCTTRILSWVSYGVPLLIVCISLVVNNTIILLHARNQIRPAQHFSSAAFTVGNNTSLFISENDHHHVGNDEDDNDDSSAATQPESKYVSPSDDSAADILSGSVHSTTAFSKDQARRLRLISSQAILFVASYVICNAWTGITGLLEDLGDTVQDELAELVHCYPIFVLQAIFSPLQGFFNMMVFIRPKYLKFRHLHKGESRLWVVRRAIFGEEVRPTIRPQRNMIKAPNRLEALNDNAVPEKKPQKAKADRVSPSVAPLPRGMVSDLTASQGDFDHVMKEADDDRWEDKATTENSRNAPLISHRKRSSLLLCTSSALDIISENQESVFEALPVLPGSEDLVEDVFCPRTLDRRWISGSVNLVGSGNTANQELCLSIPARLESSFDSSTEETSSPSSISHPPQSPAGTLTNHSPTSRESSSTSPFTMNMMNSDAASVTPSVAPSVTPSVTPSMRRQFGDYEERFQSIDSEIDAIRTSFDLDPDETRLDLSVLEIRIDELENAENKLINERHRLHSMLLSEKEKLIQMREEERLKKLAEQQVQQCDQAETQKPMLPLEIISPSQQRANEFRRSSGGLFEISKQLNISHAKNEAQGVEINRLERQLRLLADLQGVNVSDLRRALAHACEDEAYGEMQHRIAKLEAELEAAKLMQKAPPKASLSEAEESHRGEEMDALRFQVQQQQMEIHRLKSMIEERDTRIEGLLADQQKSAQALNSGANTMSQEYEELLGLLAAKDTALDEAKAALEAEQEKSIDHERMLLLNNEKIRKKEMTGLKELHFEQVLALEKKVIRTENNCADRIKDMEQQLNSLYVAVGVINEDHDADKEQRNRLSNDLTEADSKVASQLNVAERQSSAGGEGGLYSTLLMNELMSMKEQAAASSSMASAEPSPLEAFTMTGPLLIKSKGVVRKWKAKHSRLFLCGDHYQFDVGEKSYSLQFGISKIDFNPNHPLSFVVQTDPNDPRAPNIAAAVSNEEDYHKWMSALGKATTGRVN
ncbi:MAG: hypothetical protein SGBAC_005170 [Bacillariaceae sp.]